MHVPLYNLSPILAIMVLGLLLALVPVAWVIRRGDSAPGSRVHALTVLTLFLTLDLILFGAFTRLTDSGLGCPDWPGCYGEASPLAAHAHISAAQADMPSGPVTVSKAWVEMVHRYLATAVGALITFLMVASWVDLKKVHRPRTWGDWLPTLTFAWVCVQGAFGALTVTMKLFPAIVSAHLLGAYLLLALLTLQARRVTDKPASALPDATQSISPAAARAMRAWVGLALAMLIVQAASGAWVSTNYAVLACSEFPLCQGQWWPAMDFDRGFEIWRPLGESSDGAVLSMAAITAIHMAHRMLAMLTLAVLGGLAWSLREHPVLRPLARWLGALVALQLATGLSNVVLGWPLVAAIAHTGGAAVMVAVLVRMLDLLTERMRTPP